MNTFESHAVFAIASTVIMSFVYFLISGRVKTGRQEDTPSIVISHYLRKKISGFLLLGVLPAIIAWMFFQINPLQAGVTWSNTGDLWQWLAGSSVLLILLNLYNSNSPDLRAIYPEMRIMDWGITRLSIAAGGWIIYLTGYEYLFRGLLLSSCFDAFGLWPAIVINLALYSALHLPKGLKEATVAIPFGALLCYLTLKSQSILPAVFIHSLQAISCEMFCIYRNPEMNFHLLKRDKP